MKLRGALAFVLLLAAGCGEDPYERLVRCKQLVSDLEPCSGFRPLLCKDEPKGACCTDARLQEESDKVNALFEAAESNFQVDNALSAKDRLGKWYLWCDAECSTRWNERSEFAMKVCKEFIADAERHGVRGASGSQ